MTSKLEFLQPRLTELIEASPGPGASVAVSHRGEVFTAAAGTANVNTGDQVTPDTKFLIGSNTKSMTIALMCRAADDGLVDLDERVLTYLPDFRTADEATTRDVTIRQILLHTSGIGGDFFRDFGRGDDAIARLVAALPEAGVAHPVGLCWAYSNAAYVVAGRILEVVHGKPYATVLRERLLEPLGMTSTALTPEESILGRSAVGHVSGPDGEVRVTSAYLLPHAMAPAGSIVNATAADLLKFGRLILNRGLSADGEQLLRSETVAMMLEPAVQIPRPLSNHQMCLLMIHDRSGGRLRYLSSGGTTGQWSYFFLVPGDDLVLVGLTNGQGAAGVMPGLLNEITEALTGWKPPTPPAELPPRVEGVDLTPYLGRYESPGAVVEVGAEAGDLVLTSRAKVLGQGESKGRLRPIGDHQFIAEGAPGCVFLEVHGGRAEYLWMHSVYRRQD